MIVAAVAKEHDGVDLVASQIVLEEGGPVVERAAVIHRVQWVIEAVSSAEIDLEDLGAGGLQITPQTREEGAHGPLE
ncbi:hypothetical protein [Halochromatium salexigens]|uniref:hypothetical protein n=1 Tax=Halochromatium salexigens TaxID=49447 RepID=UPI001F5E272F|nr:hypothetical protein [Halochromatium salexigens]